MKREISPIYHSFKVLTVRYLQLVETMLLLVYNTSEPLMRTINLPLKSHEQTGSVYCYLYFFVGVFS